jgi:tetratricopeptide (TPR) repeat protein
VRTVLGRAGFRLALLLAVLPAATVHAQGDADRLRSAKALFFDHKYAEARQAWQAILGTARGADADAAAYWVARCSENMGEHERAFKEYGEFLTRRPKDAALVEEARTSRVGLATRLYKAGHKQHLPMLIEALSDANRTVRYYAALQLSTLGPEVGRPAVPVLLTIVEEEKDEDLVERAKLALLRLDPAALSRVERRSGSSEGSRPSTSGRPARMLRVRIYEARSPKPKVSINLPMALAEMLFQSLPDDAKADLNRKGYDAEKLWKKLRTLGPTEILTIDGEDGERIQIWLE